MYPCDKSIETVVLQGEKGMKQSGRGICATAGVLILLLAGLVYAWSVLSIPIGRDFPQWSKAQLSFTFTLVMICFCLGCFVRGRLADRIRPDLSIALAAARTALTMLW